MPYNGSGTFSVYTPGNPVVTGTTISSTVQINTVNDFATGLSTAITKDGQTTTTAAIPFALGLTSARVIDITGPLAGQISFPTIQNASADAHTLDDYEEGTFTPTLLSGGAATGRTYTTQIGRYTKIGNTVNFWVGIELSAVGSSTGDTTIATLPITSATVSGLAYPGSIAADNLAAGVTTALGVYIPSNSTSIAIGQYAAGQFTQLQDTGLTASSLFWISGTYLAAS